MLRYCPLPPPRPHSTSSQNHFPHRPMGSDGYSARYNGHFTAERERLLLRHNGSSQRGGATVGPHSVCAVSVPSRRPLLSPIWRCVCRQARGRVWEWPPFIPQKPHVERSQQPRTQVEPAGSNNYPALFSLP